MLTYRTYGNSPYKIAVIHGGPGAAGSMKPFAEMLSEYCSVLEPIQTKDSVAGQIEELKQTIAAHSEVPIILIGHSWGAMLSYLFASKYPNDVIKLILISSGPFEAIFAKDIMQSRLNRITLDKQSILKQLMNELQNNPKNSDELFYKLGQLIEQADAYNSICNKADFFPGQYHIYQTVWPEAAKMRESGKLLLAGKNINCPVIAIHGDYDPHPYQGVKEPLSKILKNFKFYLLKKCGHEPWLEVEAREHFIELLKTELK